MYNRGSSTALQITTKLLRNSLQDSVASTTTKMAPPTDLETHFRNYVSSINTGHVHQLSPFVHDTVIHNGTKMTCIQYQDMIAWHLNAIEDFHFDIQQLVVNAEGTEVACRIRFKDCMLREEVWGLTPNGKRVSFEEFVFYRFREGKIEEVWSLIDEKGLARQMGLIKTWGRGHGNGEAQVGIGRAISRKDVKVVYSGSEGRKRKSEHWMEVDTTWSIWTEFSAAMNHHINIPRRSIYRYYEDSNASLAVATFFWYINSQWTHWMNLKRKSKLQVVGVCDFDNFRPTNEIAFFISLYPFCLITTESCNVGWYSVVRGVGRAFWESWWVFSVLLTSVEELDTDAVECSDEASKVLDSFVGDIVGIEQQTHGKLGRWLGML